MDFDPNNLGGLGGLMPMIQGMQQKMQEIKAQAAEARYTGEAGGGLVKVTVSGDYQVDRIEIGEGAMEDRELLEDLLRAAMSESLRQVQTATQQSMSELTGGLPIPPGLLPF